MPYANNNVTSITDRLTDAQLRARIAAYRDNPQPAVQASLAWAEAILAIRNPTHAEHTIIAKLRAV